MSPGRTTRTHVGLLECGSRDRQVADTSAVLRIPGTAASRAFRHACQPEMARCFRAPVRRNTQRGLIHGSGSAKRSLCSDRYISATRCSNFSASPRLLTFLVDVTSVGSSGFSGRGSSRNACDLLLALFAEDPGWPRRFRRRSTRQRRDSRQSSGRCSAIPCRRAQSRTASKSNSMSAPRNGRASPMTIAVWMWRPCLSTCSSSDTGTIWPDFRKRRHSCDRSRAGSHPAGARRYRRCAATRRHRGPGPSLRVFGNTL